MTVSTLHTGLTLKSAFHSPHSSRASYLGMDSYILVTFQGLSRWATVDILAKSLARLELIAFRGILSLRGFRSPTTTARNRRIGVPLLVSRVI
jgi:hypothetical protein